MLPDVVLAFRATVTVWLLTYLLHSTALICAAWGLTRFVPLHPATRDFVWRVALLGGLVTASGVSLSAGHGADSGPVQRIAIRREVRTAVVGTSAVASRVVESGLGASPLLWEETGSPAGIEEIGAGLDPQCRDLLRAGPSIAPDWIGQVEELCATSAAFGWRDLLIVAWLFGACGGLAGLARGRLAIRDLRRSLMEAGRRTGAVFQELGRSLGPVDVAVSSELSAPCVLPGRTVGLPLRCEEELSDGELRAVLAHELAHVARRDVAWSGLLRGVAAVFWMQPLNRVGLRKSREATEEACDDWALWRTGEPVGLATSISRVAGWVSVAPTDPVPVSMAGRDCGTVTARIRLILGGSRRSDPRWKKLLVALAIAAPLPLLPRLAAPSEPHTAVWVQERTLSGPLLGPGRVDSDEVSATIVVARFRGG